MICKDAVRRLAGDLDQLLVSQENMNLEYVSNDGVVNSPPKQIIGHDEQKHVHEVSEDVHKQLNTILTLIRDLSGDAAEQKTCQKRAQDSETVELLELLIDQDLPVQLLAQLSVLEFEARKDVMNVCCALLWSGMPQQVDKQVVDYLRHHPTVFQLLVNGYASEVTALHCGVVLRSCARHTELVEAFLLSGHMPALLRFTQHSSIDISSDAFYTLREMLLAHKEVSAPWLERNSKEFFSAYNQLLVSGEYIAERQAQKLLTEILLDRRFQKVMLGYVNSEQHLKIHMNLLKDRSKLIQLEAFQVFKIFVANPQKPARVQQILYQNKSKLVALLESLQSVKPDDKKVVDELSNIIDRLSHVAAPASPTSTSPSKVRGEVAEQPDVSRSGTAESL